MRLKRNSKQQKQIIILFVSKLDQIASEMFLLAKIKWFILKNYWVIFWKKTKLTKTTMRSKITNKFFSVVCKDCYSGCQISTSGIFRYCSTPICQIMGQHQSVSPAHSIANGKTNNIFANNFGQEIRKLNKNNGFLSTIYKNLNFDNSL